MLSGIIINTCLNIRSNGPLWKENINMQFLKNLLNWNVIPYSGFQAQNYLSAQGSKLLKATCQLIISEQNNSMKIGLKIVEKLRSNTFTETLQVFTTINFDW